MDYVAHSLELNPLDMIRFVYCIDRFGSVLVAFVIRIKHQYLTSLMLLWLDAIQFLKASSVKPRQRSRDCYCCQKVHNELTDVINAYIRMKGVTKKNHLEIHWGALV